MPICIAVRDLTEGRTALMAKNNRIGLCSPSSECWRVLRVPKVCNKVLTIETIAQLIASLPTPTVKQAGELMQWLTRYLDVCRPISTTNAYPTCRSRYAYWFWDDPITLYSPDRLFIFGGILGNNDSTFPWTTSILILAICVWLLY